MMDWVSVLAPAIFEKQKKVNIKIIFIIKSCLPDIEVQWESDAKVSVIDLQNIWDVNLYANSVWTVHKGNIHAI